MPPQQRLFNRNFLFFSQGIFISIFGTNLHQVALALFIADYTNSPTFLGSVFMSMGIIGIFTSIFLANEAEKYPRRNVLVLCDLTSGTLAICLGLVIILNHHQLIYPALFIIPIFQTVVASVYMPTLQAMVADISNPALFSRANATINTLTQCAHLTGKGVAGWLYRLFGAPFLLICDGVSYFYCAFSILQIKIVKETAAVQAPKTQDTKKSWHDITAGFRQIFSLPGLPAFLGIQSAHLFFMTPIFILLPFFVKDERFLNCSADWYGYFFGAWGVGSVLGNWLCEKNISTTSQKKILVALLSIEGLLILYLGSLKNPVPGLLTFVAIGLSSGYALNLIQTTIQTATPSSVRTRTFASAIAICQATAPISTGFSGLLASLINRRIDLIYYGCGVMLTVIAAYLLLSGINFDKLGGENLKMQET